MPSGILTDNRGDAAVKRLLFYLCSIVLSSAVLFAQTSGLSESEPEKAELGAPLFPGAVFIRTVEGLDPYYESALYVTLDPMKTVEVYFERKLPEKQKAYYEDENRYMTVFLLKTWSSFSGNPSKEEIAKLEREPNIQIIDFDRDLYESLAVYYDSALGGKEKAGAIRTGHTMIRYTYRKAEQNKSADAIIGTWTSVDRDLPVFFGSTIIFDKNGAYTFTLTSDNITALVAQLSSGKGDAAKTELRTLIESRNPEKGAYVIMKNIITMESDTPVIEPKTKSGLAKVGKTLMSLEIIGQPRLSFIKKASK